MPSKKSGVSNEKADPIICFCNSVNQRKLVDAIQNSNAKDLNDLYECTGAGVGPCGGSCRPRLQKILGAYLEPLPSKPLENPDYWDPPIEFIEAISLFNRRYYWETHEVLEDLWMEEHGDLKLLYQGIIQGAAALYHVLGANPKGAIKLAGEAQKKLSSFKCEIYRGSVEIGPLIRALHQIELKSREILANPTTETYNYEALPQIRLLIGKSSYNNTPNND